MFRFALPLRIDEDRRKMAHEYLDKLSILALMREVLHISDCRCREYVAIGHLSAA
jgi:hypothetical protein